MAFLDTQTPPPAMQQSQEMRDHLVNHHGMDADIVGQMDDKMAEHVCEKMNEMGNTDPDMDGDTEDTVLSGMTDEDAMGKLESRLDRYAERMRKRFPAKFAEKMKKYAEYSSREQAFDDDPSVQAAAMARMRESGELKKYNEGMEGDENGNNNGDDDMGNSMKPAAFAEQVEKAVTRALSQVDVKGAATLKILNQRHADEKKLAVDTFCEQMLKEGRIAPYQLDAKSGKPTIKDILLTADAVTPLEKFSEGGKPMTQFDMLKAEIASRPPHRRGELLGGKAGETQTDSEIEKVERFAEQPEVIEALSANSTTPRQFVERFKELQKKNPSLTASGYGVPETV